MSSRAGGARAAGGFFGVAGAGMADAAAVLPTGVVLMVGSSILRARLADSGCAVVVAGGVRPPTRPCRHASRSASPRNRRVSWLRAARTPASRSLAGRTFRHDIRLAEAN